MDLTDTIVIQV